MHCKVTAQNVKDHLRALSDPAVAAHSQRFFKTGIGEYGEGDQFLGIRVPVLRLETQRFFDLSHAQIVVLLHSQYHEERLFALLLWVRQFERAGVSQQKRIVDAYLENSSQINNWDLVDCSAHKIVGTYLLDRSRRRLQTLAKSPSLWERRIAIIATLAFIKRNDFNDTLNLSAMLLKDDEDLIHKAVGWMLREVGNRDRSVEEAFLAKHYKKMPRIMLRYAIEKFPESQRQAYLQGSL